MNPLIAPHIRRYPMIPANGVISEVWHAKKWRHEIDRHILSPMYDAGNSKHFFIDEPAVLMNNKMIIPVRWLEDEGGDIWADAWEVEHDMVTVSLLFSPAGRSSGAYCGFLLHSTYQPSRMIRLFWSKPRTCGIACLTLKITICQSGPQKRLQKGTHRECLILTGFSQMGIRYTLASLMYLVTMYLEIGQRAGTSTGIYTLLTEIFQESFSTDLSIHTLSQHQHMPAFLSSSKESKKSLSEYDERSD